jgi:hypothetical protein
MFDAFEVGTLHKIKEVIQPHVPVTGMMEDV